MRNVRRAVIRAVIAEVRYVYRVYWSRRWLVSTHVKQQSVVSAVSRYYALNIHQIFIRCSSSHASKRIPPRHRFYKYCPFMSFLVKNAFAMEIPGLENSSTRTTLITDSRACSGKLAGPGAKIKLRQGFPHVHSLLSFLSIVPL